MAGSSGVLKEFLVKIGFKVDEQGYRNFQSNLQNITKGAVEVTKAFAKTAEAVTAGMAASGLALHGLAKSLEGVYYASQRTGASARELGALEYAYQRIGLSAEEARGSVEALAAARRTNPGLNGILGGMGIDPRQTDSAKVIIELLGKLRSMPHYQGAQIAALFGLSESTFNQVESNGPAFLDGLKRREAIYRKEGFDPDQAAKKARDFVNQWTDMTTHFMDISQELAIKLMPIAERVMEFIGKVADGFAAADEATRGWSTTIAALVTALAPLLGAMKLFGVFKAFGIVGRLLGGGAGAAGAEGAAGAAAEAGGAGLLSSVALPAIIIAAVAAALVWMGTHPDKVRGAVASVWNAGKNEAHALPGQVKGIVQTLHSLNQQVQASGGWTKMLSMQTGAIGDLARMVATFEGHAKHGYGTYKDIAGRLTAGFGHLVLPGEDFSHLNEAGALALLAKDLRSAVASVAKLVKVHLTDNQAKALDDFVFNFGEKKFANSTLLRKLNSGDYAGAADQFQYWNHALVNGHMTALRGLTDRRAAEANLFRSGTAITVTQKSDFHISSTDPQAAAAESERRQRSANADLVRNFAGAVQ